MNIRIRIFLIVGSILFFCLLLSVIKKSKISTDMATIWIIFALAIVVIAIFPQLPIAFAKMIGIESSVNAVYLIFIFILLVMVFYLFIRVSVLENKINRLIEKQAIDEAKTKRAKK